MIREVRSEYRGKTYIISEEKKILIFLSYFEENGEAQNLISVVEMLIEERWEKNKENLYKVLNVLTFKDYKLGMLFSDEIDYANRHC